MQKLYAKISLCALILGAALPLTPLFDSCAQTITFDDQGYVHNAGLGRSIVVGNFTLSAVGENLAIPPDGEQIFYESSQAGNGFGGSGLIYVGDQFSFDDPYYLRIQVNDGTNRRLTSFYIYDYTNAAGKDNISITVEGFRDNVKTGEQDFDLIGDGISKQVLSLDAAIFSDVDEVRIRQLHPFAYGPEYPGLVFAFDQFVFEDALPVQLIAFVAQGMEKGTDLFWETASETTSAYFDVERSADARSWAQIGRVAAKGESDGVVHYAFRDEADAQKERYYRLKMVDADSSYAYSKICRVPGEKRQFITVYPNPATSSVTLRSPGSLISAVELFDQEGRRMKIFKPTSPVPSEACLPLDHISPGSYLLRIYTDRGIFETKKLVKAK